MLVALPGPADEPPRSPDPAPDVPPASGLEARLGAFAAALREDAPYDPPGERQRREFVDALGALRDGSSEAVDALEELGLDVDLGTDAETGRPYAAVAGKANAEPGWGFYVVDLSRPARVAVQVPHPANDLRTDEIGLGLFRRVPGAVLAVAGTHRRASLGKGDASHHKGSAFHALAEDHARRGLPQVQLHGFNDASLPSADVVLSPGATDVDDTLERVADGLDDDLRVCRAWQRDCGQLEGRRSAQGQVAAEHGSSFVHVEVSRSVREDRSAWRGIVQVIADSLGDR
ncbi:hypothetical protein [Saccharothrix hoggarensis]|uniref:Uncharacterized protein n=1 Tax=Saccharothrix hoggarensis TaxID=913853 RepID=A0ABW3R6A8_9PSEU